MCSSLTHVTTAERHSAWWVSLSTLTTIRMPVPASDRDRPSLHTLTKVQGVFGPGGSFQHLPWETYVSMEHEGKLRRAGKILKDKKEVILEDKKLSLASASDEAELPETRKVDGILALQDVLELRAGWRSTIPAIRREPPLSPGGRRGRRRKIPLQRRRNVDLVCALCARRGTNHDASFRLDSGRMKRRRGKPLSKPRKAVGRTKRQNRDSS